MLIVKVSFLYVYTLQKIPDFYSLFGNGVMSNYTNLHSDKYTDDAKSGY